MDGNEQVRTEKDSMGEMKVPVDAYYGAQTGRAVENFPISDLRFSRRFIAAMGLIKWACAEVNHGLGLLDEKKLDLVQLWNGIQIFGRFLEMFAERGSSRIETAAGEEAAVEAEAGQAGEEQEAPQPA